MDIANRLEISKFKPIFSMVVNISIDLIIQVLYD